MTIDADHIYTLEDDRMRVTIDLSSGGKIRSLVSQATGDEFFYTDPRNEFSTSGYSWHDVSGFDECFPTVAPCEYPDGSWRGLHLGDHGWLWNRPWQVNPKLDTLSAGLELSEIPLRFERICRLTKEGLRLDYTITNHADEAFEFVYAAHILLRAESTTRIEYPNEMRQAFIYAAYHIDNLQEMAWIDWPPPPKTGIATNFEASRGTLVKLFSPPLQCAKTTISHGDSSESLSIEFDQRRLPHLGVLLAQGFSPVERDRDGLFVGLEPTTGIGDDLASCRQTNTTTKILSGETVRFWIRLSLVTA